MNWILLVAVLVLAGFFLEREIYFYEGVHLGPRVQAWLYDRWSRKYDEGKRASQLLDNEMLAQPLLDALEAASVSEPFVLDFATGTGRLSYALTWRPEFNGRILALDLSQGMLEQAASKLSKQLARVELLRHQSLPLPFPDAAFDVVCALEVLELFPDMDEPLAELGRVLRPGGILLTSRGTEESGRRAKVKSKEVFTGLLEKKGFESIQISKWWKLFDRVLAIRSGTSEVVQARKLSDVLRCSACSQIQWQEVAGMLKCGSCGNELRVTEEGIVLN